jgi:hypothetical protein
LQVSAACVYPHLITADLMILYSIAKPNGTLTAFVQLHSSQNWTYTSSFGIVGRPF